MSQDNIVYARAGAIQWLSRCGEYPRPVFDFSVDWIDDRSAALQLLFSSQMANAMTAAQGDLTGFLAKHHYSSYAGHWNKLARDSRSLLETAIGTRLLEAIKAGRWEESLSRTPLPEIDARLRSALGIQMADLLQRQAWEESLTCFVMVNVNRAALEISYRKKFKKTPIFFERLLQVYEAGRLPCGWDGSLEEWPKGRLLVH